MEDDKVKQEQIDLHRARSAQEYPGLWENMVASWSEEGPDDCAWLMYSANYLMRTGNIRWAIDPLTLKNRVPQAPAVQTAQDLENLSFVILTHRHEDHLDLSLLLDLRDLPIRWIIPEAVLPLVLDHTGLSKAKILIPQILKPIILNGVRITPFEGLHGQVPSMGYLVEFNNKRWLFPGDTRIYDSTQLPSFGAVDGVFAHLWLGKGCALEEQPPLLSSFCQFFQNFHPHRIVVTHLEELGRSAKDYWDQSHFHKVEKRFLDFVPDIRVECALMGDRVIL